MKNSEATALDHANAEQLHAANYAGVVHALLACEEFCNACADACLEELAHLQDYRRCIRLNLDCADVCSAMLRLLMRQTSSPNQLVKAQLQACAVASHLCADECRAHAQALNPCQVCAEVCQNCADKCQQLIDDLAWNEGSTAPFSPTWT
jgi:hypothetical protein